MMQCGYFSCPLSDLFNFFDRFTPVNQLEVSIPGSEWNSERVNLSHGKPVCCLNIDVTTAIKAHKFNSFNRNFLEPIHPWPLPSATHQIQHLVTPVGCAGQASGWSKWTGTQRKQHLQFLVPVSHTLMRRTVLPIVYLNGHRHLVVLVASGSLSPSDASCNLVSQRIDARSHANIDVKVNQLRRPR